jgi:hypothetical protein
MSAEATYEQVLSGLMAFDKAMQLARRIKELHAEISAPNRCGECSKWMTRMCPRERSTMSGYNDGPNCQATICREFIIKPAYAEMRKSKQVLLDQLAAQP